MMKNEKKKSKADEPIQKLDEKIQRKYVNGGSKCLVTFWASAEAAPEATSITVAGSFNDWDQFLHPMKRQKNGDFSLEVELDADKEYEFRFVVDGIHWINAWNADKYVWSESGDCDNSVIIL